MPNLWIGSVLGALMLAAPAAQDAPGNPPEAWRDPEALLLGAHRGGGALWPENTQFAFEQTAKEWPKALLEGDIRLTKDGHIVMIHDGSVDRTTNGSGRIDQLSLAEIKALDAGYRFTRDGGKTFPYRGQGITIPTFEEVLRACPAHPFIVELKKGADLPEKTVALLRELGDTARVILASFNAALIQQVRELAPEIPTCYDFSTAMGLMQALREGDWAAYRPTDVMLSITDELELQFKITPEEIAKLQEKGVVYQIHTLNTREEIERSLQMGVDSILSDSPELLATTISQWRAASTQPSPNG